MAECKRRSRSVERRFEREDSTVSRSWRQHRDAEEQRLCSGSLGGEREL